MERGGTQMVNTKSPTLRTKNKYHKTNMENFVMKHRHQSGIPKLDVLNNSFWAREVIVVCQENIATEASFCFYNEIR